MDLRTLRQLSKRYFVSLAASAILLATVALLPSPLAAASLLWLLPIFVQYRSEVRRSIKEKRRKDLIAAEEKLRSLQEANRALESDIKYAWRLLEVAEKRFVTREHEGQ